jgi:hypothetical protein
LRPSLPPRILVDSTEFVAPWPCRSCRRKEGGQGRMKGCREIFYVVCQDQEDTYIPKKTMMTTLED